MIQVEADCTVELVGTATNPGDYEITINPGWNWIGFPSAVAISIEDAFADFTPEDEDQIKSEDNFSMYYEGEWGAMGDLRELIPGKGFMYYSNSDTTKVLIFPSVSKNK